MFVYISVHGWLRKNHSEMDKTNLYDINGNNVLKKQKDEYAQFGWS